MRNRNEPMVKVMVKCLNLGMPDTVLFQAKHIKQPQLKYSNIGNKDKDIIDDYSKAKYFDAMRMTEVHMERCQDVLYVKLQKAKDVPDWVESSPTKNG